MLNDWKGKEHAKEQLAVIRGSQSKKKPHHNNHGTTSSEIALPQKQGKNPKLH